MGKTLHFFRETYDVDLKLRSLDIPFGILSKNDRFKIVNFFVSFGKKYIHMCRIKFEISGVQKIYFETL